MFGHTHQIGTIYFSVEDLTSGMGPYFRQLKIQTVQKYYLLLVFLICPWPFCIFVMVKKQTVLLYCTGKWASFGLFWLRATL